jgi:hypothetical protein
MRWWRAAVLTGAACGLGSACASGPRDVIGAGLEPPPWLTTGPMAAREASGIGVIVGTRVWEGFPRQASGRVTPIQITLRNHSGRPILVRYADLALVGPSGRTYAALPPAPRAVPGPGTQVFEPAYSSYGFSVSPDLHLYYPTFPVAFDPFPDDRAHQRAAFAAWPDGLPTADLREHALPEGVLENRGFVTGYLYFRGVPTGRTRVCFRAHSPAAPRGAVLATLDLRVP